VLTFDGTNLQLWLYYPDTQQQLDIRHLMGARADVTASLQGSFRRNDTSNDGKGDFFIGSGSNLSFGGTPSHRLYPFKGKIQEVALYKSNLAGSGPNFDDLFKKLVPHETSGGNV
jgi:hypothetical protein